LEGNSKVDLKKYGVRMCPAVFWHIIRSCIRILWTWQWVYNPRFSQQRNRSRGFLGCCAELHIRNLSG